MMMRAGLGVGLDRDGAGPDLLCAARAKLIAALRSIPGVGLVAVELLAGNHAHPVVFPAAAAERSDDDGRSCGFNTMKRSRVLQFPITQS